LIVAGQLRHFFGVSVPAGTDFFAMLRAFATRIETLDPWVTATGAVTLALAGGATVPTVGALPSALPPLSLPSFDPETWRRLAPAALALTVLGLTEAVSIARALALRSGQRIDGSQEFVGQGLSNLAGAFFSAYPSSGSFNRSGVNLEAGARTPLAAVFSAVFLLLVLLVVAPLAAYL